MIRQNGNFINKNSINKITKRKNKDYSISLDYVSEDIGTLDIPKIAYKDFSEIKGKGLLDYVVNIGVDFGNSSTKIVYSRETKKNSLNKKNEGLELNCEELNILLKDNIPQSIISLDLIDNGKIKIDNFKLNLLDKLSNLSVDDIYKQNEYYFCIYYIACLLQFAKFSIIKEQMLEKRINRIEWNINMGMPSDGKVGNSKIKKVFRKILSTAICLSSNSKLLSPKGINLLKWKDLCDKEIEINHDFSYVNFEVYPELYAEALNLYESDNDPGERAIIVDVGSVTLDITFILKIKDIYSNKTNIILLNPNVLPLGMEKLIAKNNELCYGNSYNTLKSFADICFEKDIPKLSTYIKKNYGELIAKFYKDSSSYFDLKNDNDYKFYWFGGARDASFIKQLFLEPFKKNSYLYNIKPLYQPNFSKKKNEKNFRYSVAYGLILADSYINHPSVSYVAVGEKTVNYSENLLATQQNIYGN